MEPDHPLFVDPKKDLTRFDKILINKFRSLDSIKGFQTHKLITSQSFGTYGIQLSEPEEKKIPKIKMISCSPASSNSSEGCQNEEDSNSRIANSYRHSLSDSSSLDILSDEDIDLDELPGYAPPPPPGEEEEYRWGNCQWRSLSTIPEAPTPTSTTPASNEIFETFEEENQNIEDQTSDEWELFFFSFLD